jgi:hypothetical protein
VTRAHGDDAAIARACALQRDARMRYRYDDEGYRPDERRLREQGREDPWDEDERRRAWMRGYAPPHAPSYERPHPYVGRDEERWRERDWERSWDRDDDRDRAMWGRARREALGYAGYVNHGPYGSPGELGRTPLRAPEQGARSARDWLSLGPKGYRRSDERIREDVCDRLVHLAQHAEVDSSDVDVLVKDAEVTLAGTVRVRRWKHLIEDVADGVPGVRDIHNELRVRREGRIGEENLEERRGTTGATSNYPQNNGPPRGPPR